MLPSDRKCIELYLVEQSELRRGREKDLREIVVRSRQQIQISRELLRAPMPKVWHPEQPKA